jgi:gas vesicle protein
VNDRNGKTIVPFAPAPKDAARDNGDPIEQSGQAIVALLKEAADTAKATCEHAMKTAQKLSVQLDAVERRVKKLESDVQHYQDRAARAENWLARVATEIEEKFFRSSPVARSG